LADDYLKELVETLFTNKRSITRRIENSLVWREQFAKYLADLDGRIGPRVRNIRAAKHRHESQSKPRGRFCLYLDAYVAVAEHMIADRDADIRHDAVAFLSFLTDETLVQTAMLADASDEGLFFTRACDDEDTDPAELQSTVRRFITKLECLFVEGRCVDLPGYTSYMLESLTRTRVVRIKRDVVRSFGGARPAQEVIDVCIGRMRSFVKVAIAVTVAEFPNYELCASFRIFSLEGQRTTSHSSSPDDETAMCMKRLCKFFDADLDKFAVQFDANYKVAFAHRRETGCTNIEAWRHAVKSPKHTIHNHPSHELLKILLRYVAYSVSTARIESNFSQYKRCFGEQGLLADEHVEERVAKMVLTPVLPGVLARAQAMLKVIVSVGCAI